MNESIPVFVSVGSTSMEHQEAFVSAVEARLRSEGLVPQTVGRNVFGTDRPLKTAIDLLQKCSGAVVIAFERLYFPSGLEKRGGPKEQGLEHVRIPTPWNHIEAAMAYIKDLPLMVIAENGLREDGVLEHGNDWYVQRVDLDFSALNSLEFNSILADWKRKIESRHTIGEKHAVAQRRAIETMTLSELIGQLGPKQAWAVVSALVGALAGAFALGLQIGG